MAKKRNLDNYRLADDIGGEYSANPSDYFMVRENQKLGEYLIATEHKGGWTRTVIVKRNPTLKDLKKVI